jgi:C1A family cysteine protease
MDHSRIDRKNDMPKQRYGWVADQPDIEDHLLLVHPAIALPPSVDLREQCPPVYDQGELGSCVANAVAAAMEFDQHRQSLPEYVPSRLLIYYNARAEEGTIPRDSGARVRDGIKALAKYGACPEALWPYIPDMFAARPPAKCYNEAFLHKAFGYRRIPIHHVHAMKATLASGLPFVFGFYVYSSFESDEVASSGVMPMPVKGEEFLDGHCVMAVGYDDEKQMLICRNSWSADWGQAGYFEMPYDYLTTPKLTDDFWVLGSVS